MIGYGIVPDLTQTPRGSSWMRTGATVSLQLGNVEPVLQSYSWNIETSPDNPLRSGTSSGYTLTTKWFCRYTFEQTTFKVVNNAPNTTSLTSSSPGFDGATLSPGIGAVGTQTYLFPSVAESKVFDLPTSFDDDVFEGGVREWSVESYTITYDSDSQTHTAVCKLTARTVWMPIEGMETKLVLPALSSIKEAKVFS